MTKRVALLVVIFILGISAPALAAQPGTWMIEGQIINGTKGGGSVANQDITLKIYLDNAEVESTSTRTDSEGRFVFDGLSTELGYSYEVSLFFHKAEYYSEWLTFAEGETAKSIEVTVYDSTTSDEAIKVAMAHTVIYVGQDSLTVMEYYLFVNEADRTYIGSEETAIGEKRETLGFSMPEDVTEPQITLGLMECCIMSNEEGFIDTMPVLPGNKEVAYSYEINHNSGTYTFSRNVNYPTGKYDLLFQGEGIDATGGQLTAEEPMDIEGIPFNHLSGSNLAPGDVLVVKLSGLPWTNSQGAIIWTALALVVLVIGSGFVYLLKKRRLQPVSPEASLEQMRQGLLVELAQLDDDFESGKIPENVHRRLRAERKAQLVELMQRSKEESGDR